MKDEEYKVAVEDQFKRLLKHKHDAVQYFSELYDRWCDEWQYEDWKDYENILKRWLLERMNVDLKYFHHTPFKAVFMIAQYKCTLSANRNECSLKVTTTN